MEIWDSLAVLFLLLFYINLEEVIFFPGLEFDREMGGPNTPGFWE